MSEYIEFSELEILQLSEFYEITARSGDDTIRRIIMIPTSGFPDDRESAAVNSVVKDRACIRESAGQSVYLSWIPVIIRMTAA